MGARAPTDVATLRSMMYALEELWLHAVVRLDESEGSFDVGGDEDEDDEDEDLDDDEEEESDDEDEDDEDEDLDDDEEEEELLA